MENKFRILILEDIAEDAELLERELRKGGIQFQSLLVKTRQAYEQGLKDFKPDLILSDYKLPSFDGMAALAIALEKCPDIPFIFVSGTMGEEFAIESLKSGATDYVSKWKLFRLNPCIQRAMKEVEEKTQREQAEKSLKQSEEQYRRLVELSPEIIMLHDQRKYVYLNPAALKALGASRLEEIAGRSIFEFLHPDYWELVKKRLGLVEQGKEVPPLEEKFIRLDKRIITVEVAQAQVIYEDRPVVMVVGHDITEKKRSEEEKASLQAQYYQAQKMEAVGQLAGGFAHDFNNSLTLISVCSQLILMEMGKNDPFREKMETIYAAIERSASLARQLLAFSRRQVMEMKVLDLNGLLRDLDRMIYRVIGENITLTLQLDSELKPIKADPGQVEHVIINLIVNARDAMPNGGTLSIETRNIVLGQDFAKLHPEVIPGHYVSITVADTGLGMPLEVQKRIFEPFFTTKEKGKGTGLGLSSVYGIVKQSGGYIYVESAPGQGSIFRIYLPPSTHSVTEGKKGIKQGLVRGGETILVVEDEKQLRDFVVEVLLKQGYKVLKAANGGEAFLLCEKNKDPICLMVTDVIMPGISGKEVAERCVCLHPEMKVLYMSGYSYDDISQKGILDEGVNFIPKPFTIEELTSKIRKILASEETNAQVQPGLFGVK